MILKPMWTLKEGQAEVTRVQWKVRAYGYHVALGGSVLNDGGSFKDLDIYFLPLDDRILKPDPEGLTKFLTVLWGEGQPIEDDRYGPSLYYIFKLKFFPASKRIDAFALGIVVPGPEPTSVIGTVPAALNGINVNLTLQSHRRKADGFQ